MVCAEWFLGSRNLSTQRYTGGLRQEGTLSFPGGTDHQLAAKISDKRSVVPDLLVTCGMTAQNRLGSQRAKRY